jgi:hypothetical protein
VDLFGLFERVLFLMGWAVLVGVVVVGVSFVWLASKPQERGSHRPPIFGHTEERDLMMTAIEAQVGKQIFKRPLIKGLQVRTQRQVIKTKDAVALAQERNRLKNSKGT